MKKSNQTVSLDQIASLINQSQEALISEQGYIVQDRDIIVAELDKAMTDFAAAYNQLITAHAAVRTMILDRHDLRRDAIGVLAGASQ
jgi:hypothetical protein